VPHLARALRVKLQLNAAEARVAAALDTFDLIDAGIAIVDRGLRPIAINQRLEQILFRHDGLALSRRTLRAGDQTSTRSLGDMVWHAASEDPRVASARTMLLRRPSGRLPWSVTVRRLHTRGATGAAGLVVLLIEDLMREPGEIEPVLGAVFNLTPREATLAAALANPGRQIVVDPPTGIPEPATALMLLAGIAGLAAGTRRR
jgi:PAS domain-containing protein